jgi:hypothetical protein
MVLYSVNAISGSTESQGEVTVRLQTAAVWSTVWGLIPISLWHRPRPTSAP